MNGIAKITDLLDDWLGRLCRAVIFITMLALLSVIAVNVAARYFLEAGGVNEVGEIPELLFPWLIGAGIILGVQRGAHIAVDFYSAALGPRGKIGMVVFVNAIIILAYGLLLQPVLQIAEITGTEHTPFLHLPRSIGFYALALTFAGTMFSSLALALRVLARGAEAAPHFDPEESVT